MVPHHMVSSSVIVLVGIMDLEWAFFSFKLPLSKISGKTSVRSGERCSYKLQYNQFFLLSMPGVCWFSRHHLHSLIECTSGATIFFPCPTH